MFPARPNHRADAADAATAVAAAIEFIRDCARTQKPVSPQTGFCVRKAPDTSFRPVLQRPHAAANRPDIAAAVLQPEADKPQDSPADILQRSCFYT
jgi:hypothetical protein